MRFVNHLATRERVAASRQNQALCAVVFLYKKVLGMDIAGEGTFVRAKRPQKLPVVLRPGEVRVLLGHKDVRTSMIYTHLVGCGPLGVRGLFDR